MIEGSVELEMHEVCTINISEIFQRYREKYLEGNIRFNKGKYKVIMVRDGISVSQWEVLFLQRGRVSWIQEERWNEPRVEFEAIEGLKGEEYLRGEIVFSKRNELLRIKLIFKYGINLPLPTLGGAIRRLIEKEIKEIARDFGEGIREALKI